jgi:hypothetical protein
VSGLFDDATDSPGWVIPIGWTRADGTGRDAACRSCRAEVLWCTTPSGKRAPINRDGTSHFATCPQADAWRKRA